jgi:hypothetical protein
VGTNPRVYRLSRLFATPDCNATKSTWVVLEA